MTRRGLFGALLGGIAAGFGISKAGATPFGLRPASGNTARVALVADDPDLEFVIRDPIDLPEYQLGEWKPLPPGSYIIYDRGH